MIDITKACTVTFLKAGKYLVIRCREKSVNLKKKKKKNCKNKLFKALASRFRLTLKLISCVKEQQNCLWMTFY